CTWFPAAQTASWRLTTESRSPRAGSTRSRATLRWSRPTWAGILRHWRALHDPAEPGRRYHLLRANADSRGDLAAGGTWRDGLPARRQRFWQVDHAEDDLGCDTAAVRQRPARRRGRHELAGAEAHRQGDRDRAGEQAAVRADDGQGKPGARRDTARRRAS